MNRKLVVLDLDETLVKSKLKPIYGHRPDFRIFHYYVYKRPYLLQFLRLLSKHYTIGVWSAGGKEYVDYIVYNIFTKNRIPLLFVWNGRYCDKENFKTIKNLQKVSKRFRIPMNNITVIDDLPETFSKNKKNAIQIRPFNGSKNDVSLKNMYKILLKNTYLK